MRNLMKVTNKRMYRIQVLEGYESFLVPGKEIVFDENYKAFGYLERGNRCFYGPMIDEPGKLAYELHQMKDKDYKSKEEIIDDLKHLSLLAKNVDIQMREIILEENRTYVERDIKKSIPSRLHGLFLTDKKSLPYWEKQLSFEDGDKGVFEVEVTGDLFKSSDDALNYGYLPMSEEFKRAHEYWENTPIKKYVTEPNNEYLFNGKVKIIRRVK